MPEKNTWCKYSTIKFVTIDDKRLATFHYVFQLCIFLYIVVYQVIGKLGYADSDQPIGSLRISYQPAMKSGDPNKDVDYQYNFSHLDKLRYCDAYGKKDDVAPSVLQCLYFGEISTNYPVTGTSPFFVTTRVQESNQSLVCNSPPAPGESCNQTYAFGCDEGFTPCYDKKRAAQRKYFVADVELGTIMLDHAVQSPSDSSLAGDVSTMKGYLKKCDTDEKIMPSKTPGGQDYFTINQLLSAVKTESGCGTTLDDVSTVSGSTDSVRYEGTVIIITISYSNAKQWSGIEKTIEYSYSVTQLKGAKTKSMEAIWTSYPKERVIKNRHGITFTVLQDGQLRSFSAITMLTTLTTSLALLAFATTIVDALMNYCLKDRELYRKMKYAEIHVEENQDGTINYEAIEHSH